MIINSQGIEFFSSRELPTILSYGSGDGFSSIDYCSNICGLGDGSGSAKGWGDGMGDWVVYAPRTHGTGHGSGSGNGDYRGDVFDFFKYNIDDYYL